MKVYVLRGGVGGDRCHVEVFEDSEKGRKIGEQRKSELTTMNRGWALEFDLFSVKGS